MTVVITFRSFSWHFLTKVRRRVLFLWPACTLKDCKHSRHYERGLSSSPIGNTKHLIRRRFFSSMHFFTRLKVSVIREYLLTCVWIKCDERPTQTRVRSLKIVCEYSVVPKPVYCLRHCFLNPGAVCSINFGFVWKSCSFSVRYPWIQNLNKF